MEEEFKMFIAFTCVNGSTQEHSGSLSKRVLIDYINKIISHVPKTLKVFRKIDGRTLEVYDLASGFLEGVRW
jgi:hypothetical protein